MITYAVKKTRNPKNPDADYFYGVAVKTGELNFEKLAKRDLQQVEIKKDEN